MRGRLVASLIPVNVPLIGEEEVRAVSELMEEGRLTSSNPEGGAVVRKYEEELTEYLGARDVVAVNSGTSALLVSLMASGIGEGDEVIVPALTFTSTANVVSFLGAEPVFVDITLDEYGLDPEEVESSITDATRAVIGVHLFGHPFRVKEMREICDENRLLMIEDAAQALGSTYEGKRIGAEARLACFSTYASKMITTGEGGFVATDDPELAANLRRMRTHGHDEPYRATQMGLNLRLPEILAAIGLEQLRKLPDFVSSRRRNAQILNESLHDSSLDLPPEEGGGTRYNWNYYSVRVNDGDRDSLSRRLSRDGIGSAVYYPIPLPKTPLYAPKWDDSRFPNSERASDTLLSLPVHPAVSEDQARWIGERVLTHLRS